MGIKPKTFMLRSNSANQQATLLSARPQCLSSRLSGEGGIEDTGRLSRVSFGFVWTTWTSQETHTHTHKVGGIGQLVCVSLCVCVSCEICRATHAIPSRFPITTHYTLSTSHLLPNPSLLDSLSHTHTLNVHTAEDTHIHTHIHTGCAVHCCAVQLSNSQRQSAVGGLDAVPVFIREEASGGVMLRAFVDPLYLPHDILLMFHTRSGKALCSYTLMQWRAAEEFCSECKLISEKQKRWPKVYHWQAGE